MQFIVTLTENPTLITNFSPEAMFGMLEQTSSLISDYMGQGKIKSFSAFADQHGGLMIVNVDSNAELFGMLESLPARVFCDVEARATVDFDEWRGMMDDQRERMK